MKVDEDLANFPSMTISVSKRWVRNGWNGQFAIGSQGICGMFERIPGKLEEQKTETVPCEQRAGEQVQERLTPINCIYHEYVAIFFSNSGSQ